MPNSSSLSFSLWNTIPTEIQHQILNDADLLTKYLHNLLPDEQITSKVAHEIWIAAVEYNFVGDLSLLPNNGMPDITNGLLNNHQNNNPSQSELIDRFKTEPHLLIDIEPFRVHVRSVHGKLCSYGCEVLLLSFAFWGLDLVPDLALDGEMDQLRSKLVEGRQRLEDGDERIVSSLCMQNVPTYSISFDIKILNTLADLLHIWQPTQSRSISTSPGNRTSPSPLLCRVSVHQAQPDLLYEFNQKPKLLGGKFLHQYIQAFAYKIENISKYVQRKHRHEQHPSKNNDIRMNNHLDYLKSCFETKNQEQIFSNIVSNLINGCNARVATSGMNESVPSTFNTVTSRPLETPHLLISMDSGEVLVTVARTADKDEELDYVDTDPFELALWSLDLLEYPELDTKMELLMKLVEEGDCKTKTE
ncbi:hypothetical protein HDU76_008215 [Blyttiomyces sp. JEL0837]|nr:hypothetical protein HDU76_008215 [Blyttiomyces sp. JEL0837]